MKNKEKKKSTRLDKLRSLPESKRKIIFWSLLCLIAIVCLAFWVFLAKTRIEGLRGTEGFEPRPEQELKDQLRGVKEELSEVRRGVSNLLEKTETEGSE